jgi:hypothetical protein
MNKWRLSIGETDGIGISDISRSVVYVLNKQGFSVKLVDEQPDMYKTFDTRYVYEISHVDERAVTVFLLSVDTVGIDMRIED